MALQGRRSEVFIFTKCGATDGFTRYDWPTAGILSHISESLRRLRTDYLDLVQRHSCDAETLRRRRHPGPATGPRKGLDALHRLQRGRRSSPAGRHTRRV
ncbi:MAG: aldo/keto reductase [Acidobacteriota bacterium]